MNRKKQLPTRPFFARFLEKQVLENATGGGPFVTDKFPSDSDEVITMKYPSDGDDNNTDK
jgi:hypothetical protein